MPEQVSISTEHQAEQSPVTLQEAQRHIALLYDHETTGIVDAIEGSPLHIVTARKRMGKSRVIIPEIQRKLRERGYESPRKIDCDSVEPTVDDYRRVIDRALLTDARGILVLDEADYIRDLGEEEANGLLASIHNRGYSVIAVIPHEGIGTTEKSVPFWQKAEVSISGFAASVTDIEEKLLDDNLARELLAAPNGGRSLSPDVVDFFIKVLPHHLYTLYTARMNPRWDLKKAYAFVQQGVKETIGGTEWENLQIIHPGESAQIRERLAEFSQI